MAGLINTLSPGGGVQNIANAYSNVNQALGYQAFKAPGAAAGAYQAAPAPAPVPNYTSPKLDPRSGGLSQEEMISRGAAPPPADTTQWRQLDPSEYSNYFVGGGRGEGAERGAFDYLFGGQKPTGPLYASQAANPQGRYTIKGMLGGSEVSTEATQRPGAGGASAGNAGRVGGGDWGGKLEQDTTQQRKQSGTSPYSYIQLANALANQTYANMGLTEEQVIEHMNAIKASS